MSVLQAYTQITPAKVVKRGNVEPIAVKPPPVLQGGAQPDQAAVENFSGVEILSEELSATSFSTARRPYHKAAPTPVPSHLKEETTVELRVTGQGTIWFELNQFAQNGADEEHYVFYLYYEDQRTIAYEVRVNNHSVLITDYADKKTKEEHTKEDLLHFLQSSKYMWISIDKRNSKIMVGHGYMRLANRLVTYALADFYPKDKEGNVKIPEEEKHKIAFLKYVATAKLTSTVDPVLASDPKYLHLPLVLDPSPVVVHADKITFDMLGNNTAIPHTSLGPEAQYLYGVVASPSIQFTPEERDALIYSTVTPNMTLYEKIAEKGKHGEFGENYVYIRVTMRPDEGDSPGSPFVVELWPSGKRSPIHNHSNAVALIKVLFGQITCRYFNPLAKDGNPRETEVPVLEQRTYYANEVTYLTPHLYQTHQLINNSSGLCATIQSYRYLDDDSEHYEYFDYLKDTKPLQHFEPDSDFDLLELLKTVKKEYAEKDLPKTTTQQTN